MANPEQLEILKQDVTLWNQWRQANRSTDVDLRQANLREAKLRGADLNHANLENADLIGVDFSFADLSEANLRGAKLVRVNLTGANLAKANLSEAILTRANLHTAQLIDANLFGCSLYLANLDKANLSGANLEYVDFSGAHLIQTIIDHARFSGSKVYGVNVWDLQGEFAEQKDLVVSPPGDSIITVDNVKIAQFIYLILNNKEIRHVINTLTSKSVLILGRFTLLERKNILDALRNKLREYDLLPIVFDFDRPTDRDYTETVQTLVSLSLFVIVDVTNPKSTPLEMEATVKQFKIPYVPIIDLSADPRPFAMMIDSQNSFHWVLQTFGYHSKEELLENIDTAIISRALEKHNELRVQKAGEQKILTINDLRKANP
jgi:uncharacterized protein YjbI with pentapeptide repeats